MIRMSMVAARCSIALIALSTAGCPASGAHDAQRPEAPLLFRGADVDDPARGLIVRGGKEAGNVVVGHPRLGFALVLPWAEDWVIDGTVERPVYALSVSRSLIVSVNSRPGEGPIDEESWLRDAMLPLQRERTRAIGGDIEQVTVEKVDDHAILEYIARYAEGGRTLVRYNAWGVRTDGAGWVYTVHASTTGENETGIARARKLARTAAARGFHLTR